ncbi:MAG: DUF4097 family beta strand repeat-containing protein [Gemmatimonadota bacterium]|nr:MAG: DUF4097 family beta strand repeat-containing protein [Gemmatimonadota bacterium]
MNSIVIGAVIALSMAQQTDTTVAANGATLLNLENTGGQITVTTWDRDEVRIRAGHSSRTSVKVRRRRGAITIEAESRRGPTTIVDYEITVPRSMDLRLEGMFSDITVEGADGDVSAETMRGNVTIRGGDGQVRASSTTGAVRIEDARGAIEVETVADDIRIVGSSGTIVAESVGGSIILEDVDATIVEAGTVGGRIIFNGAVHDGGEYLFSTHGGTIQIAIPGSSNVSITAATIYGSISSDLPGAPQSFRRGERASFTLGNGSATLEVETFGGRIRLRRLVASGGGDVR